MTRVLSAIFVIVLSFNAFANQPESFLACSNGTIQTKGDGLFTMEIFEDSVSFSPYEGGFEIQKSDMTIKNNKMAALDVEITYYVEGMIETRLASAFISISEDKKSAHVTYSIDSNYVHTEELQCVTEVN